MNYKKIKLLIGITLSIFGYECQGQLTATGYSNLTLQGFNVLIEDSAYIENAVLTQSAIDLLDSKLQEITQLCISQTILDSLKAVSIFVDWNTTNGAAQYHPSLAWLLANGYIAEKEKSVEISNISNFVAWTNLNQPFMVLHELAHAFHHRVFNYANSDITNAFNSAISTNLYHNVQYHHGNGVYSSQASAYALNNEQEYFAEISEAYFGLNDYYPFTNNDLQTYDPVGYAALQNVWSACITGVEENYSSHRTEIFPNPSSGLFTIRIHSTEATAKALRIIDTQGRLVYEETNLPAGYTTEINLRAFSKGIYFISTEEKSVHSISKLVLN
ncbi:MAG: T9SS type A sorting domain-containing protein [Bacteroidetes bacterium]|nr:MAG: T9SS type A sorting domain-containing protein [Bacteroidota bacterium]